VLIVHQDELEQQLAYHFTRRAPQIVGNNYLVLGTVDVKDWREGLAEPTDLKTMLDRHHPFKGELEVKSRGGWQPVYPRPATADSRQTRA
jgi:hypothetical protein